MGVMTKKEFLEKQKKYRKLWLISFCLMAFVGLLGNFCSSVENGFLALLYFGIQFALTYYFAFAQNGSRWLLGTILFSTVWLVFSLLPVEEEWARVSGDEAFVYGIILLGVIGLQILFLFNCYRLSQINLISRFFKDKAAN